MKDNLSLIAAATGGFMLSVALAGILSGTPVAASRGQSGFNYYPNTSLQVAAARSDESTDYITDKDK
ncbi:hypothetical protein H6G80_00535 [Nostoc sp. FACHB-87]|uniref:hypothetical protein n=1 Tax=Nostocales TaxID=1161 RepID=UPI0016874894|nr:MULTISPECIES: hypothetical protein [Nostocales]MBD2301040.1 hypothetical protein [Nostoc sp. FACHB-190]MBD2452589.1 hypothetical protein [Nostoc sp. FACHB-87]MBD2473520.1 hypothetical protein [Anabaena sp. FACHB-83]MBD2486185.1 hypothetical protein [Aulosira sp. FACHB-615]